MDRVPKYSSPNGPNNIDILVQLRFGCLRMPALGCLP